MPIIVFLYFICFISRIFKLRVASIAFMLYLDFMKKLLALILLIAFLLTSCTVTQKIALSDKNSGSSESDIHVEQFFVDVLEDFSEFLPSSDKSIMDEAMTSFANQLTKANSTKIVDFEKTGENSYILEFEYTNIDNLISELGAKNQSIISSKDKSFSFYVDINNFEELTKIVPFLADPNFEVYGPLYNQGTSEEDYLDMIYYLLGEEGPEAIENGTVSIDVKVPGTITKVDNAAKISTDTARFTFPIIDFLLLNEPLHFTVNWK